MKYSRSLTVLLLAGSAACGAAEEGAGDPLGPDEALRRLEAHGQQIEIDASAQRTDKAPSFFMANTDSSYYVNTGAHFNTHLCMLTTVRGNFSDYSPSSAVFLAFNTSNYWRADEAQGGSGQVVCTSWSNFIGPSGSQIWLSGAWYEALWDDGTEVANLWWGDAASFVTEARGEFEGAGEDVWIGQSSDPFGPSKLNVRTQHADLVSSTYIRGSARSVFIGNPSAGKLVRMYGYVNGSWVRGDVSKSGTFTFAVGGSSGYSSWWLPPFNNAVCYLARVSGDYDNNGDQVSIYQNGSQWYLRADSEGQASARCLAYDQR